MKELEGLRKEGQTESRDPQGPPEAPQARKLALPGPLAPADPQVGVEEQSGPAASPLRQEEACKVVSLNGLLVGWKTEAYTEHAGARLVQPEGHL